MWSHRARLLPHACPMGAVGPELTLQFLQHVVLSLSPADGMLQPRTHCADSCCSPLSAQPGPEVCAVQCQQGMMEGDSETAPRSWASPGRRTGTHTVPRSYPQPVCVLQLPPVQICVLGDETRV